MKTLYLDCSSGMDEYALLKILADYIQPKKEVLPILNETFKVVGSQDNIDTWIDSLNVSGFIKMDMHSIARSLKEVNITLEPKNWVLLGSIVYLFEEANFEQVLASTVGVLSGTEYTTAKLLEGAKIRLSYDGKGYSYLGAAILKHYVDEFGDMPTMMLERALDAETLGQVPVCGYVGELEETVSMSELVCNIDDMTPEELANVEALLYENGAYDVYITNIHMKKNRPGQMLTCMCASKERAKFVELIFQNTTTLGMREYTSKRYWLEPKVEEVDTPFGKIHAKVAKGFGTERYKYEFDELAEIARRENLPLTEIKKQLK